MLSDSDDEYLLENSALKVLCVKGVRSCAVHPLNEKRDTLGEYHHLFPQLKEYPDQFFQYTRMEYSTFQFILNHIQPQMVTKFTNFVKQPIEPEEKLVITLRVAKMLNGKVNGITMGFMNIFGFQLGLCIFLIFSVEAKDIALKMRYVIRYCFVFGILFICTRKCQKIKDKSQELRDAVYGSSWTDKPRWLRKSLTVMITMANKDLQISPYGIYVLDMSYMTNIIKASYTYFNILNTLKA
ncbi:uncharacterized protein LOC111064625 isoform X1 [Nilaparvata lugens]|uniref:uncharacterized protein LOC111064625 isoform X1 n=1 Tax=Nilaparvata lugens TaxID=108931 RepID=UPI00193CE151|nr:uncharacterized protein LOC111064625 isoform X1 [Nilaparvata lugens]